MAEKKVVFPEHVMQRIRDFVESAPPFTPEQEAIIRGVISSARVGQEPGEPASPEE